MHLTRVRCPSVFHRLPCIKHNLQLPATYSSPGKVKVCTGFPYQCPVCGAGLSRSCANQVLQAVPAQLQQIVDLLQSIDQKLEIIADEKVRRQSASWLPIRQAQQ